MTDEHNLERYLAESGRSPSQELTHYVAELTADANVAASVSSGADGGGLLLPSRKRQIRFAPASRRQGAAKAPIDYWYLYVALDDYAPPEEPLDGTPESVIQKLLDGYDRRSMLVALAALNRQCDRDEDLDRLLAYYRSALGADRRRRLDESIARMDGTTLGKPRIVARQCVLAAMKEVLRRPLDDGVSREQPELWHAIMLTHALGAVLGLDDDDGEMLGEIPAHMMLYLVQNHALYQEDDAYASIDRTIRLWRDFGPRATGAKLRAEPAELLREATGLDLEDLLAMGFAAWGSANAWSSDEPLLMSANFGVVARERVELFLGAVAASP